LLIEVVNSFYSDLAVECTTLIFNSVACTWLSRLKLSQIRHKAVPNLLCESIEEAFGDRDLTHYCLLVFTNQPSDKLV